MTRFSESPRQAAVELKVPEQKPGPEEEVIFVTGVGPTVEQLLMQAMGEDIDGSAAA